MDLLTEFSQLVRFLKEQLTSNLAIIVSRTLQSQYGRIRSPVDRNLEFLNFSRSVFVQF